MVVTLWTVLKTPFRVSKKWNKMKILAIDTTSTTFTAVLIDGDKSLVKSFEVGKSGHSSLILPTISALLEEGGVKPAELDGVAVVVGPGSFTGIRIGVSAMTAIAYGTGAKRISVNSFELLAYSRENATCAVDAGHGHHYVCKVENGKIISTEFVEEKDKSTLPKDLVTTTSCSASEVLEKIVRNKWESGKFVSVFEPFYMRKSQAERNNEI